jgi:hypothetical protein
MGCWLDRKETPMPQLKWLLQLAGAGLALLALIEEGRKKGWI